MGSWGMLVRALVGLTHKRPIEAKACSSFRLLREEGAQVGLEELEDRLKDIKGHSGANRQHIKAQTDVCDPESIVDASSDPY